MSGGYPAQKLQEKASSLDLHFTVGCVIARKKKINKEGYLSKVVMGSTFIINITKGFFLKIRLKP